MTRGMRNCNPLNIQRVAGTKWRGQSELQTDKRFVQFETIEWGIRAAFCILRTYASKHNAFCINDIISRWAPPREKQNSAEVNDTQQYIRNVCHWTGFAGMQRLTERNWPKLVKAMARQECGVLLSDSTLDRGFSLYKHY